MGENRYFDKDASFWNSYLSGRPQPPAAFYDQIRSYHSSHGGEFTTAHDAGAGVGVHTSFLAEHFHKILVSDIESRNVRIARERHSHLAKEENRAVFHTAALEDANWIERESVDLVFAASCINWCSDLPLALSAISSQLKPGGTLAIAGMGFAAFPSNSVVQDIWYRLFQHAISTNILLAHEKGSKTLRAMACDASAYDAVPIPEEMFEKGARRYRLNFPDGWSWYSAQIESGREDLVPRLSEVGRNDVVVCKEQEGWSFEADMEDLKKMADSFPIWEGAAAGKCGELWEELGEVVGEGKVKGVFPAVLILARKNM